MVNKIDELLNNNQFRLFMNLIMIVIVCLLVAIIIVLVKNIDIIKLMAKDNCAICIEETGAKIYYPIGEEFDKCLYKINHPEDNFSNVSKMIEDILITP